MIPKRKLVRQTVCDVILRQHKLRAEEIQYRVQIHNLLDKFEEKIKWIEITSSHVSFLASPPHPDDVDKIETCNECLSPGRKFFKLPFALLFRNSAHC